MTSAAQPSKYGILKIVVCIPAGITLFICGVARALRKKTVLLFR